MDEFSPGLQLRFYKHIKLFKFETSANLLLFKHINFAIE